MLPFPSSPYFLDSGSLPLGRSLLLQHNYYFFLDWLLAFYFILFVNISVFDNKHNPAQLMTIYYYYYYYQPLFFHAPLLCLLWYLISVIVFQLVYEQDIAVATTALQLFFVKYWILFVFSISPSKKILMQPPTIVYFTTGFLLLSSSRFIPCHGDHLPY